MKLSERILGTTTTRNLRARTSAAVLIIGRDTYTRGDLGRVECFNFNAAQTLSAAIATFQVADTRELFDRVAPSALALPHIGPIALAVLGACFELRKLGGGDPLGTWVRNHTRTPDGGVRPLVTFTTIKKRDAAARATERKARRRRP